MDAANVTEKRGIYITDAFNESLYYRPTRTRKTIGITSASKH